MLACPLCHQPLTQQQRQWRCVNQHSFDEAKEGYINLLAVQHKRSKQPGDNLAMSVARQHFLRQGHYDFLAQALVAHLPSAAGTLLDLGCGEGYFSQYIQQHAPSWQALGVDISKSAVKLAAKACNRIQYVVASNHRLPLADKSIDLALRIMAPSNNDELLRVLKPKASLLMVRPARHHLQQLKALIYDDVREHDETPDAIPGMTLVSEQKLQQRLVLNSEQQGYLSEMTPLAWRKTEKLRQALEVQQQFEVDAEFIVHHYQRYDA